MYLCAYFIVLDISSDENINIPNLKKAISGTIATMYNATSRLAEYMLFLKLISRSSYTT